MWNEIDHCFVKSVEIGKFTNWQIHKNLEDKMKTKIAIFGAIFLVFIALTLMAQPRVKDERPFNKSARKWFAHERLAKKLNLTEEQKQSIQELHLKLQKELLPLRSELQSKMLDYKSEMIGNQPSQGKINSFIDDISKVKAEMHKKKVAQQFELRGILTEEQREMLKAHKKLKRWSFMGPMKRGKRSMRHGFHGGRFDYTD
jgi:Spy/CpxP family protein refolding chaperone